MSDEKNNPNLVEGFQKLKRQLLLKKVKLSENQNIQSYYKDFLETKNNYFKRNYSNKYIYINRIKEFSHKDNNDLLTNINDYKKKKVLNNSKTNNSKITYEDNSKEEKKKIIKRYNKPNEITNGKHYIDDKGLDELFEKYTTLRNFNKTTNSNFYSLSDVDTVNKQTTTTNMTNLDKIKFNRFCENNKSTKYKYNKSLSTFCIHHNQIDKELQPKQDKNLINPLKVLGEETKKEKKFLSTWMNLAQSLGYQEDTLLLKIKNRIKFNKLRKNISSKICKDNKNLLLINTDNFRLEKEIKDKIQLLDIYLRPEGYYNWYKDLKNSSGGNTKNLDKNVEHIRNPVENEQKFFYKKKYKQVHLKRIFSQINKNSHDLRGMIVKGKNLMKLEKNYAKSIKGKKYITRFEDNLKYEDVKDQCFSSF